MENRTKEHQSARKGHQKKFPLVQLVLYIKNNYNTPMNGCDSPVFMSRPLIRLFANFPNGISFEN